MRLKAGPVSRQALPLLATWLSVLCLLILRRPDAILNPQFWAEDGVVFFHDQLDIGFVQALFNVYAGYLHVIPRFIAGFASVFPVTAHPLIYNTCALAIAALSLSLFSARSFRSWLRSDVLRVYVSLAAAGVVYADELIGTVTDLQWFLAILALLLFFKPADPDRPEPAWRQVCMAVLGLLISLSSPLVVILLPFVFWRLYIRTGWDRLPPLGLALGAFIQLLVFFLHGNVTARSTGHPGILAVLESSGVAIVYRVILSTVFGHLSAKGVADGRLGGILLGVASATIFWIAALVARADGESRKRILVSLYLLSAPVMMAIAGRDLAKEYAALFPNPNPRSERYFFLGGCILIYLMAVTIQMLSQSALFRGALLVLVFSGGAVENFRALPFNDLHWAQYAPAIDRWLTYRREHKPREQLAVPVNPWNTILLPAGGEAGPPAAPSPWLNTAPKVEPVTPASGAGRSGAFRVVVSHPAGAAAIADVQILFNQTLATDKSCWVDFSVGRSIALRNDEGNAWLPPVPLNSGGVAANSQCSVPAVETKFEITLDEVVVTLPINFTPAFQGPKKFYVISATLYKHTGWQERGSWAVK